MGLSYHFSFYAPPETTAGKLEDFLRIVEKQAKVIGFNPTLVLNASFDNVERKEFARRVTPGLFVENEALQGVVLPQQNQVFSHDPISGTCRLAPEHGMLLVLTDCGLETILGFLRFPETLSDVNSRTILHKVTDHEWSFRDSLKTPDPRLRTLVKMFADCGYLREAQDDFNPKG